MKPTFTYQLSGEASIGFQLIGTVKIKTGEESPSFTLVLESEFDNRVALCACLQLKSVSPVIRTNSELISSNAENRLWSEERRVILPSSLFNANKVIEIFVLCLADRFSISLNGHGVIDSYYTVPLCSVRRAVFLGDVKVCCFAECSLNGPLTFANSESSDSDYVMVQPTAIVGPLANTENFVRKLGAQLRVGTRVLVALRTHNEPSFIINFENQTSKNIVFHFNPRAKDRVIVRNTLSSGKWHEEERKAPASNAFPLAVRTVHDFEFTFSKECILVKIDAVPFCTYHHRVSFETIDTIVVSSVSKVLGVAFA